MCHKEMDGEWQNRVLSLDKSENYMCRYMRMEIFFKCSFFGSDRSPRCRSVSPGYYAEEGSKNSSTEHELKREL